MGLLTELEKPNQVVKITNPSHKYFGEEAVIQLTSPKMYRIRLLNRMKPFMERFIFDKNDKVMGTSSKQVAMRIAKTSVTPTGRLTKPQVNTWHGDTSKLLDKYLGKTKAQVLADA